MEHHPDQALHTGKKRFLNKTATIKMRIDPYAKAMIDRAAQIQHTDMSHFILSHALDVAKKILADETQIGLSSEQYEHFCHMLDNPPAENVKKMNMLLQQKTILDK